MSPRMTIEAPVVLITGASSGIGLALSHEYAKRGYNLILAARRTDRLEQLSSDIRIAYPTCLVQICQCDVGSEADLKACVQDGLARFGRIDVAIANAGFAVSGIFEQLSNEDWERQFKTNFYGVLNTVRAALPALKETRGRIGIIGSVNSYVSLPANAPYAASKYAVRALAESLKQEFAPSKVSVTLICPGFIESEIRQVDKQGRFRKEWKDFVPNWLVMKKEIAARKIASAIERRSAMRPITFHGWLSIFIAQHFAFFYRVLFFFTRKKMIARYVRSPAELTKKSFDS